MEKCLRLKIFAKIHHDSKHYITIEVFGDFEHSQIFTKNSVANKFQSTVSIAGYHCAVVVLSWFGRLLIPNRRQELLLNLIMENFDQK